MRSFWQPRPLTRHFPPPPRAGDDDAEAADGVAAALGLAYPTAADFRRDARAAGAAAARFDLSREASAALLRPVAHPLVDAVVAVPHAAWTALPGVWCDVVSR